MKQNKNNVWKIVLISLSVAAVAAVVTTVVIKAVKKNKAKKSLVIEWNDEEAFEECMNGDDECEIIIISDAN